MQRMHALFWFIGISFALLETLLQFQTDRVIAVVVWLSNINNPSSANFPDYYQLLGLVPADYYNHPPSAVPHPRNLFEIQRAVCNATEIALSVTNVSWHSIPGILATRAAAVQTLLQDSLKTEYDAAWLEYQKHRRETMGSIAGAASSFSSLWHPPALNTSFGVQSCLELHTADVREAEADSLRARSDSLRARSFILATAAREELVRTPPRFSAAPTCALLYPDYFAVLAIKLDEYEDRRTWPSIQYKWPGDRQIRRAFLQQVKHVHTANLFSLVPDSHFRLLVEARQMLLVSHDTTQWEDAEVYFYDVFPQIRECERSSGDRPASTHRSCRWDVARKSARGYHARKLARMRNSEWWDIYSKIYDSLGLDMWSPTWALEEPLIDWNEEREYLRDRYRTASKVSVDPFPDYYDILGLLPVDSTNYARRLDFIQRWTLRFDIRVKRAFLRLMREANMQLECHATDVSVTARFKLMSEARHTLLDPSQKERYDAAHTRYHGQAVFLRNGHHLTEQYIDEALWTVEIGEQIVEQEHMEWRPATAVFEEKYFNETFRRAEELALDMEERLANLDFVFRYVAPTLYVAAWAIVLGASALVRHYREQLWHWLQPKPVFPTVSFISSALLLVNVACTLGLFILYIHYLSPSVEPLHLQLSEPWNSTRLCALLDSADCSVDGCLSRYILCPS